MLVENVAVECAELPAILRDLHCVKPVAEAIRVGLTTELLDPYSAKEIVYNLRQCLEFN